MSIIFLLQISAHFNVPHGSTNRVHVDSVVRFVEHCGCNSRFSDSFQSQSVRAENKKFLVNRTTGCEAKISNYRMAKITLTYIPLYLVTSASARPQDISQGVDSVNQKTPLDLPSSLPPSLPPKLHGIKK